MEEPMSNQDFERDKWQGTQASSEGMSRNTADKTQDMRDKAKQAFASASDMARDAGEKAKQAASDTASSVTQGVKDLLNQQIGTGAELAGHFAKSVRLAADDLAHQSPMAAGLIRSFANTVDDYADGINEQTVDQLARSASDYTRRRPALVFGLAAMAGFFVFRTMKSAQSVASPSLQPKQQGENGKF
jgi:ElaB/YqjD/DUF883 family membrane-anchored ribosome-binding protein